MSFSNYSNLRTAVSTFLDVTDVTTTSLDDLINIGERYVWRKLRVEEMEASISVTVNSAGVATLPADYVGSQFLYLDRVPSQILQKKTAEWIFRNYADRSVTGIPLYVAESNSTFLFGPRAAESDVIKGTYYARTLMSSNSTINSVVSEYPEIFLWAALANAELFLGRDQRMIWQAKCDEAIQRANQEDRRKKFSGSPVAMSPG